MTLEEIEEFRNTYIGFYEYPTVLTTRFDWLLAEVKRLQAENERLRSSNDPFVYFRNP